MKRSFFVLAIVVFFCGQILLSSAVQAGDKGFRYINQQCQNAKGEKGYNPSFFGQCSDFRGVTLSGVNLDGVDFSGSLFQGANLEKSSINQGILIGVRFDGANLSGVQVDGAVIHNSSFQKAILKNMSFFDSEIIQSSFMDADFRSSQLSYVEFDACDFTRANFESVTLDHSSFHKSILVETNLKKTNLVSAQLQDLILKQVALDGANLTQANLAGADLQNCTVQEVIWKSANLSHAGLMNMDLKSANFELTMIAQTNFKGSDLRGANFVGAKGEGATWEGAKFNKKTQLPFSHEDALQFGMLFIKFTKVMILWDLKNALVNSLLTDLAQPDVEFVLSTVGEANFVGPIDADVDVIIHVNGNFSKNEDMPVAGQKALLKFVTDGGIFFGGEWNSYEYKQGRYQSMRDLILFDYSSAYYNQVVNTVAGQAQHPLLKNVPANFKVVEDSARSTLHVFESNPSLLLMEDAEKMPFLAVRNVGKGRVVGTTTAINSYFSAKAELLLLTMMSNTIAWD